MMKEETTSKTENALSFAYRYLSVLPKVFLELICKEMGWSEATFYRRMKKPKSLNSAESNAILSIFEQVLSTQLDDTTSKAIRQAYPTN